MGGRVGITLTRNGEAGHGEAGQGRARQGKARQGQAGLGEARQGNKEEAMTQAEIYQHMEPGKEYTTKDIAKALGISRMSVQAKLKKLYRTSLVDYRGSGRVNERLYYRWAGTKGQ